MSEADNTSPPPFTNACCYNCGHEEFEWGMAQVASTQTISAFLHFLPDQKPHVGGSWFAPVEREGLPLRARRCLKCGNVQFFTEASLSQNPW